MVALVDRAMAGVQDARRRSGVVDHLVRLQEHYGTVKAGQQAGAVTYFAFLSFFPVLALAFFVVGYLSHVYPDADRNLREAIDAVLPGIVGHRKDQLSIDDIRGFSGWAGLFGLLGVLYSGLNWVSALRDALTTVFELPTFAQPSFVLGKLRDLITLVAIGVVLFLAVAVTGFVSGFSGDVLAWIDWADGLRGVVTAVTVLLGLAANAVLFFMMYRLLVEPPVPVRSLWKGAVFGAIGFEALKQVSKYLLAATKDQPAFQAFGIALILVVWINYFSRVVLYSAAFAYTTPEARAARPLPEAAPVQGPPSPPVNLQAAGAPGGTGSTWVAPYAAGAASTLGLMAVLRKLTRKETR